MAVLLIYKEDAMRGTAKGKAWRSEAEWRTICGRFAQSGLGVAEFCAREKLALSSFQTWDCRCRGAGRWKGQFIAVVPVAAGAGRWSGPASGTRLHLRGEGHVGRRGGAADWGLWGAGRHAQSLRWVTGGGKGLREEDPLSGTLVVFINWRDTYVKCLYWDRTGFWLFATRLERGRFRFPANKS